MNQKQSEYKDGQPNDKHGRLIRQNVKAEKFEKSPNVIMK